ncbi:hypothetical protein DL96DRAFT_1610076 [Flagelloscypha sp. PMI_526]|nr:hypothetical protein DL96DRAFT_1610076 [Flagelloscypha sp. PMI_526]
MESEQLGLFVDITKVPLDVLRVLFEHAASADHTTACTLSLVSHEIQSWTDPLMFRFLNSHKDHVLVPIFKNMCGPTPSPRLLRARSYVRGIAWNSENYLAEMADDPWSFDFLHSFPSLHRVRTGIWSTTLFPVKSLENPFWMSITHFHVDLQVPISSLESPFAREKLFSHMIKLTHLAIRAPKYNVEKNLEEACLHLCLWQITFKDRLVPIDIPSIRKLANGSRDERIVLWDCMHLVLDVEMVISTPDDIAEVWSGCRDGFETYWQKAEAIVQKRRS